MEMEFQGPNGRRVVLRGMNTYPAKVVSSQRMEAVLRHQDIEWAVECFITSQDPIDLKLQYPEDIQAILHKHDRVFESIPPGRPLDRGFEHSTGGIIVFLRCVQIAWVAQDHSQRQEQ